MENLTWTAKTEKGNEYIHTAYSDPYPGRSGSEILKETCGWCAGTGVYEGPSGYKFYTKSVEAVTTGCFRCDGTGFHTRKVSSARATARRQINAQNQRRAADADFLAAAPVREAEEYAAALEEAYAEQARRDALPKGFLAEEGTRLRKIHAKVTMIRSYESQNFVTGAPELGWLVKFNIDGKSAVWFTGAPGNGFEEGDEVTLSATVKKHGERDGEDQTILTRCIVH